MIILHIPNSHERKNLHMLCEEKGYLTHYSYLDESVYYRDMEVYNKSGDWRKTVPMKNMMIICKEAINGKRFVKQNKKKVNPHYYGNPMKEGIMIPYEYAWVFHERAKLTLTPTEILLAEFFDRNAESISRMIAYGDYLLSPEYLLNN